MLCIEYVILLLFCRVWQRRWLRSVSCSTVLTGSTTGKFFNELASAGAWVRFYEFNKIELEVLSVIAQQVRCGGVWV